MIDDGRFFTLASLGVILGTAVARGSLAKVTRRCDWADFRNAEVTEIYGDRVRLSVYDPRKGETLTPWVDKSEISNCRPPLPA